MEQSAKSVGSDTQDGNESHIGLSAPVAEDDSTHSRKETREIVTPYAFQVAPELLGTPLATPCEGPWPSYSMCLLSILSHLPMQ